MLLIAAFVAAVFLYSLASRRLERTVLTAPLLFTTAGVLMAALPVTVAELKLDRDGFLLVAELGLVMTLFTDASKIGLRMLKGRASLPTRLLSVGMLLTLLLGAACAKLLFGSLSWAEAGILAAILAPTDAGLGQLIVSSPRVPQRIRQALNVEAGLNDGLSVPFLLFFFAIAAAEGGGSGGGQVLGRFLVEQLGYGAVIGLAIGLAGGGLLGVARRRDWMSGSSTQLGVVALPLACVLASEACGASMFISAFVAGLAAKAGFDEVGRHSVEFAEEWGQLFNFFIFFLFGLLVARAATRFDAAMVLYAVLSLTVVRMVPVAIALIGTGMSRSTTLFVGWFGPRGLASIVLGVVYLEKDLDLAGEATISLVVMATVLLSIVAHGLSTLPGIGRYARILAALDRNAPEFQRAEPDGDKPRN